MDTSRNLQERGREMLLLCNKPGNRENKCQISLTCVCISLLLLCENALLGCFMYHYLHIFRENLIPKAN